MNFYIIDIKFLICTFIISQKLFLFFNFKNCASLSDRKIRLVNVCKILTIKRVNEIMGMFDICITSKQTKKKVQKCIFKP